MIEQRVIDDIRIHWREVVNDITGPAKKKVNGTESYICPICGHGRGGDGLTFNPQSGDRNGLKCFGCGFSGDVIDLYMAITGTDFTAAAETLAEKLNVDRARRSTAQARQTVPQTREKTKEVSQHRSNEKTAETVDFTDYYEQCEQRLTEPAATRYLKARGISQETAALFSIGFDPQSDPANAPGAISDTEKRHPEPRIIIPCTKDFYIARAIQKDAAYKSPNPKGSRTQLFNGDAVRSAGAVIVTEGIFDALAVIECGHNAIALNGIGNGRLLLDTLKHEEAEPRFIICFDNDKDPKTAASTKKSAAKLNSDLQAAGYASIVYNIAGKYKDANEALQADRNALEEALQAALKELNRDDIDDFLDRIRSEAYRPHETGLPFLDRLLSGGIVNQSLMILAAAPATGKTTLAQQIAETLARNKRPVTFINFEMSREQLLAKAISADLKRTGYNKTALQVLQGYEWTPQDKARITAVIKAYRKTKLPYIRYNPEGATSDLKALQEYLTAEGEEATRKGRQAPAVIIDYLHLITAAERIDTAELIKRAITTLKGYAVKYNTFVIAISATSRSSSKGRLTLASGRDSSNIEYTADYQLTLNYEAIDSGKLSDTELEEELQRQQGQPRREMILRLTKSRFTEPGKSEKVHFDAAHNTFYGVCENEHAELQRELLLDKDIPVI